MNSRYTLTYLWVNPRDLIPTQTTASALDIAQLFVREIVRLHGVPAQIISDRDAKLTSKFWRAMFQSLGTLLNLSLSYHPKTHGQIERVNQTIEDMLRTYCGQQPHLWLKFVPLVKLLITLLTIKAWECHSSKIYMGKLFLYLIGL